jgi:shikimate kinase
MKVLWLVGMMGSGKTVVGEKVAAITGVPFIDTDRLIELESQQTVAEIWESAGEAVFRSMEGGLIARIVAEGARCVVATGGGAILTERSREAMKENGLVIWLTADVGVLHRRLESGGTRPLLDEPDIPARLTALLDERRRWYAEVADHEVDTTGKSLEDVAEEVTHLWSAL